MLQTVLHQQKSLDASWGVTCRPAVVLTTVSIAIRGDADGNPVVAGPLVDPAPSEVDPAAVTGATVLDSKIGKR